MNCLLQEASKKRYAKTTEQILIVRFGKSEAEVTSNKRL